MLSLLLALTISQTPQHRLFLQPNLEGSGDGSASLPLFSALGTDGLGTSGPCSTTAPTGSKGEVLVFGRSSLATCSKRGLRATGILPGDLVMMSSGQPRVEPDEDWVLGLRYDPARVNFFVQASTFVNAAWIKTSVTVTGSDGGTYFTDPFGTFNATKIAWGSNTNSYMYQNCSTTGAPSTRSIYVRATPGAVDGGVLPWCTGGSVGACKTCPLPTDGTWSRCEFVTDAGATSTNSFIGCDSATWGGSGCPGGEALIYGAQCEGGSPSSAFIQTGGATAGRVIETAKFAISAGPPATSGSMSVVTTTPDAISDTGWATLEGTTGWQLIGFGAGVTRFHATGFLAAAGGPTVGRAKRSCGGDGTSSFACTNTTCATGAGITTTGVPTFFWAGDYNLGFPGTRTMNGIISRLCWDPSSLTKCR